MPSSLQLHTGDDVGDLRVAGDGDSTAILRVVPDRVVAALALQRATVASQVLFESGASQILGDLHEVHHTSRVSRITSLPASLASRSASSLRTSRSSRTASWIISRASSWVLPWLCAPGISGTETTHQPSSVCS